LRFLQLYVLRLGFLDGMAGVQVCMLQSFFITFMKQARLWEMEQLATEPRQSFLSKPSAASVASQHAAKLDMRTLLALPTDSAAA